jgi:hypothetical protein
MSKINRSLHERFNRNHSPKCVTWEGANTTHKITCFDPTRSIRRANDWTLSCIVKNDGNITLPCIYSDYDGLLGLFVGLNNVNPSSTFLNIIIRNVGTTGVSFDLGNLFTDSWLCVTVSYNSSTNSATVYANKQNVGTQVLSEDLEWAISNGFGIYSVPGTFSSNMMEGSMSSYCILDKQVTDSFIESFNTFGLPDEGSFSNVTFFTTLDKVNDQVTFTGLESSTTFFNPSSTTRFINFIGWTDEELGLDVETNGISANCLIKDFYDNSSPYELSGSTVVEKYSGFQPRRNGLKFEASKRHYLKIANLPQLDVNKGCTIIMIVKDFPLTTDKELAFFSDEVSTNDLIRILYRTGTPNVIAFNSNVSAGAEMQVEVDSDESSRLVFKLSNETQIEPKNTFNKLASVNKDVGTRTEAFVRNGATYDLFLGGIPGDDLPTFGTEQYADITFEAFILVNGILSDADIDKIVTTNKIGNVPIELQDKYDFEVIADFNDVYDDLGTLKVKDLSGNDHSIVARGSAGFGWNNLSELQASQTKL